MENYIDEYIKKHNLINKNEAVVIALSGGIDSMVLFHCLYNLGYKLIVCHINHKVRPESDKEYEEIKNLYAELFDIAQHYDESTNSDYQAALEALEFYGMNYEEMDKQVIDMVDSIQKGIPYEIKTNFKTIVLF